MEGYKYLTMFYNSKTEEPESWEFGQKIISTLKSNDINYTTRCPEDEIYETTIFVRDTEFTKATELLNI